MDIERLRAEFPALSRYVYMNHAGVAAPSTRVARAANAWLEDLVHNGIENEGRWEADADRVRASAARLVSAAPDEIAFVRNTSHALGLVAEGLPFAAGDEVAVATSLEYPSNVYPWLHLRDRGVVVREIVPEEGGVTARGVEAALTDRTRLVAVSSVQYATGHRTDLEAIGRVCRERGVLFCVDGIQSVGCIPVDVKRCGVHFLGADSHKWMMGMPGIGFLFVDRAVVERLRPVLVGWHSTTDAWNFDRAFFDLRRDAAKLEEGSPAYALIAGLGAALALLEEVGIEAIAGRIGALLDRLERGLRDKGCDVSPGRDARAGILTFVPREGTAHETLERLHAAGVRISLRRGRLRVSPHFVNLESEIDRLIDLV